MTEITTQAALALRTAVRDTRLSAADLRVYEALIDHARGDTCRPSRERIAQAASVHPINVPKHTARLAECGHLVVKRTKGRHTNVYQLPCLANMGITDARVEWPANESESAPVGDPSNRSEIATVGRGSECSNRSESASVGEAKSLRLCDGSLGSEITTVEAGDSEAPLGSEITTQLLRAKSDAPAFADAGAADAASTWGSEDGSAGRWTDHDRQHLEELDAELFGQEKPGRKSKGEKLKPGRRRKPTGLTFAEWAASLPEGQSPLPDDDAVFGYARSIGLPAAFIVLGWEEFARSHLGNAEKRQLDWLATFRTYVRKDWLRLWRRGRDGWDLTTAGEQLFRELAAEHGFAGPLCDDRREGAAGRAERLGNEAIERLGGDESSVGAHAPPAVARTQQMLAQLQARRPSPRHESVAERVERRGRESERWLESNGQFAPADGTLRNCRPRARPNNVTQDFSDVDYSLDGDGDDR